MEEPRGAKLTEIIKQLGLNESVNSDANGTAGKGLKIANVHRISARGKGLKFVPVKRPGKCPPSVVSLWRQMCYLTLCASDCVCLRLFFKR